jgi:hypothetical protein
MAMAALRVVISRPGGSQINKFTQSSVRRHSEGGYSSMLYLGFIQINKITTKLILLQCLIFFIFGSHSGTVSIAVGGGPYYT